MVMGLGRLLLRCLAKALLGAGFRPPLRAPIPCRPELGCVCIGKGGLLGKEQQGGNFMKRILESHRSPLQGDL